MVDEVHPQRHWPYVMGGDGLGGGGGGDGGGGGRGGLGGALRTSTLPSFTGGGCGGGGGGLCVKGSPALDVAVSAL
jgi:hypothetical protein